MEKLTFDRKVLSSGFKMMNCTNGGPWHKRHAVDQFRSNFDDYKALKIPYSRNHDSALHQIYGGPYSHDISCIFPKFDADPYDPASYDFACTDESIEVCLDAGTKTFFRLGQTIEHQIKKHHTLPPKDYKKWAVIAEHIIRHCTEGWAEGHNYDMPYWEIWNEPDLNETEENKRTWGGTREEFFDFYEIAAKHLKSCFPHLKIGGPAIAGNLEWAEHFLKEMQRRKVPIDFFSWHIYNVVPNYLKTKSETVRILLDRYGYTHTENILNEWNYIKGWGEQFVYSIKSICGMKGAAFTMASMTACQHSPLDMLMYYDTRPSVFNGVFDYYTYEKLKGYYPFLWYAHIAECTNEILADREIPDIYSLCGITDEGKVISIITYYTDNDSASDKALSIDPSLGEYEVYLLDRDHDGEMIAKTKELTFTLKPCSCILIKEI